MRFGNAQMDTLQQAAHVLQYKTSSGSCYVQFWMLFLDEEFQNPGPALS
jgi:hypothetical protein